MKFFLLFIAACAVASGVNAQCDGGTVNPSSRVVCEGASYTFTVSGAQGNLQWQQNTVDPLSASDWSDIAGATNATYLITNVLQSTWLRVVSNPTGCAPQTSSVAIVHIAPPTLDVSITNITPTTLTVSWEPFSVGQQNISWTGSGGTGNQTAVNSPFTITGSLPEQCLCVMVSQSFTCPNTQPSEALCTPVSFDVSGDAQVCAGAGVSLQAIGSANFSWSPAGSLSTSSGSNVVAQPTVTTTYTVTAVQNGGFYGMCTSEDTVVIDVLPCGVPTNLQALYVDSANADISWSGDECAVKYRVRVQNMITGAVNLFLVNAPDTTKALTGLSPNTLYKIQVRSQCSPTASVLSSWSTPIYFTTSGIQNCTAPANVNATATSNTTAEITWTPVAGAAGYRLRYRMNGTTSWSPIIVNNGAASNQTISGLLPNTTYDYQIRTRCSINPLTWSNFTAIQTFTTPLRLGENVRPVSVCHRRQTVPTSLPPSGRWLRDRLRCY